MIRVVGFIGNAGAGKTTAANYLVSKGYNKLRFAQALKTMLMLGLGIDKEYVDGSKKDEPCEKLCGVTCRVGMITLGTEWGREMIHKDIWVKALERALIREIGQGQDKFVIDDFRFLSEVEWLNNLIVPSKMKDVQLLVETCLIRIVRDSGESIDHQSETEQKQIAVDFTIDNNKDVNLLYGTVDVALEYLFKKKE